MSRTVQVVSGPSYEPVSLAAARAWVRLESDDTVHDAILTLLIKAMREDAENLTQRAFIQRQLKVTQNNFNWSEEFGLHIELPFPPLISVDSFKYYDTDGTLQTLATDQYVVHADRAPGIIVPAWQVTWPTIRALINAVQVTFTCGYAPGSPQDEAGSQEVIPASLKLWMEAKMATLFENREQIVVGNIVTAIPRDFTDHLLDSLTLGSRLV